jgi:hypothetical protein
MPDPDRFEAAQSARLQQATRRWPNSLYWQTHPTITSTAKDPCMQNTRFSLLPSVQHKALPQTISPGCGGARRCERQRVELVGLAA